MRTLVTQSGRNPARNGDQNPGWWGVALAGLGAGGLLALSLPPWGFWPLALVGIVVLDRLLAGQPAGNRFRRGLLVGLGLLAPSILWLADFTIPGYVIATGFYAGVVGTAMILVPPGAGRRLALPAAWLLAEGIRGAWPFGGVPLSELAVGQVAGPLAPIARLGGTLLLGAAIVAAGAALSALIARQWKAAIAGSAAVLVVLGGAAVAPDGHPTGELIEVAYVQGGGPQGTRAEDTDEREVFERHLDASEAVPAGVDVVLWPEDVVDVAGTLDDAPEGEELAALARRLDAVLIVGAVEDLSDERFRNRSVVYGPDGQVIDSYEKVRRVPFGEWVPFRSFLEPLAGNAIPARDASVGDDPAVVDTPAGRLGVTISWEVFFGDRGRDAIGNGGEVLLNPTNGSSFRGTLVQSQQIASSRLRAIETGRWVVQAAPTGFSAFVTPGGDVLERTSVSERSVQTHVIALRHGDTPYVRWGEWPTLALAALALAGAWLLSQRWAARISR